MSTPTRKELEQKLNVAKTSTSMPEKQRDQFIAMYTRKLAELDASEKKPDVKAAPVKKEAPKDDYSDLSYSDYEGEVLDAIEKEGDLTRSDAQGIAMSFEDLIQEHLDANKSPLSTAKDILKRSAARPGKKAESKAAPKKSDKDEYDCDELIKKAEVSHAKRKAAAKERAEAPKKTEVTKTKEKIEKVHEVIEKQVEAGKFGKAQLDKLITETEELLTFLKKARKSL